MTNTTNLSIGLVAQNQSQKEVTVNTAIMTIDAILNRGAIDKDLNTPPGSPTDGDLYIVGGSPTGGWSSNALDLAYYQTTWKFINPNEGMALWVNDENVVYTFDGTAWIAAGINYLSDVVISSASTGQVLKYNGSNWVNGSENDIALEYTKAQNFNATTLTDGTNISWNLESNQVASVTLAGNRTLDNPTNMKDGGTYILTAKQDSTGSRTLAFGTAYKWPAGAAPTLSTGVSAVDILTFVSDGTNMFGVSQLNFS